MNTKHASTSFCMKRFLNKNTFSLSNHNILILRRNGINKRKKILFEFPRNCLNFVQEMTDDTFDCPICIKYICIA